MKHLTILAACAITMLATSCDGNGNKSEQNAKHDTIRIEDESAPQQQAPASQSNAKVVELTTEQFQKLVASADAPTKYLGTDDAIVDFWAPWCKPCQALGPVLAQLSANTGITIYKVNVDDNQEIAARYGIQYIPSLFYCHNSTVTPIANEGNNYTLESLTELTAR